MAGEGAALEQVVLEFVAVLSILLRRLRAYLMRDGDGHRKRQRTQRVGFPHGRLSVRQGLQCETRGPRPTWVGSRDVVQPARSKACGGRSAMSIASSSVSTKWKRKAS